MPLSLDEPWRAPPERGPLARHAVAQPVWPEYLVTIVAANGSGSADDVIARLAAPILSACRGQPAVVQNFVGAASTRANHQDPHADLLSGWQTHIPSRGRASFA